MKITYYGTAGGGGLPEMFCSCRVCEYARKNRGKDVRTRSQAVIEEDGEILCIDFPVDAYLHTLYGGLDMRKIKNILITHAHYDHFLHQELFGRPQGYAPPLNLFLSAGSSTAVSEVIERKNEAFRKGTAKKTSDFCLELHILNPFVPQTVGGFTVTPLIANHPKNVEPFVYIIEKNGKTVYWGHDSGALPEASREFLREWSKNGKRFDFASLDCTLTRGNPITKAHMDLNGCAETADFFRSLGIADENTAFYLSHIGHLVDRTQEELTEEAAPLGLVPAYDGLSVEV